MAFELNDYVDVATRLRQAHERWPELRVEEALPELVTVGDRTFVQATVTVYRTPDDPRPTSATVWEPFPGLTTFSKNSEVPVGMTSALGRALAYMGLEVRKSIASRDEVAARRPEPPRASQSAPTDEPAPSTPNASPVLAKDAVRINALLEEAGIGARSEKLRLVSEIAGRDVASSRDLTRPEAARVIEHLSLLIAQKGTDE